ncbi:MAG TPA: 50S ribosomal protein L23 [Candidatus Woesearchaeota archaeon]|nr:50S ribosomal protein L23 [Candidatus Woesearchaeota archaeon]
MDDLKYPIATEKAVRLIESDNVITFVVGVKSSKQMIKSELEKKFKVKVDSIKTVMSMKGKKKAYIRLKPEFPAIDIATQLGLM